MYIIISIVAPIISNEKPAFSK